MHPSCPSSTALFSNIAVKIYKVAKEVCVALERRHKTLHFMPSWLVFCLFFINITASY